jgi:hypothetical protein
MNLGEVRTVSDSQDRHIYVMLMTPAGQVFQATLRVNGADRSQAFVSIGGLTSDVLVKVLPLTLHVHLATPWQQDISLLCSFRASTQSCVVQLQ